MAACSGGPRLDGLGDGLYGRDFGGAGSLAGHAGVRPELLVLATGTGSLILSHVGTTRASG